jgi:hypothetical protein
MQSRDARERIAKALHKLDAWIEQEHFRGWDPHDALNSRLVRRLTLGNRLLGIAWLQLFKRSPINLRTLVGVDKGYNPKGMGLFLATYLRKYRLTSAPEYLKQASFFADWLKKNVAPGYSGACWGYNFDWPNRGFFAPAGTPTIVNTAFIASALSEYSSAIQKPHDAPENGEPASPTKSRTRNGLSMTRSACDFVLQDLNTIQPAADEICFSYTPLDRRFIHNANVLGGWLLATGYIDTGESHLAQTALDAARFTVRRQRADGSWLYGESLRDHWIDNYHTGFVLVALKSIAARLKTDELDMAIDQGYQFWKERMFLPDGTPKYYPDKLYPIDVHSLSQAILTFIEFADWDPEADDWAWRVALWSIRHMQDPEGFFHYQIHRRYRIRIPYIRWAQAWMQLALTDLLNGASYANMG